MAHSKTFKTDHNAGVVCRLSPEEQIVGAVIRAKAESDRKARIYSPFYTQVEPMTGDDLALYRYSWKQVLGKGLSLAEGIKNRRATLGY